jgi:hypothetical protein
MVILKLWGGELFVVQQKELVDSVGAIVSHLERPNSLCATGHSASVKQTAKLSFSRQDFCVEVASFWNEWHPQQAKA